MARSRRGLGALVATAGLTSALVIVAEPPVVRAIQEFIVTTGVYDENDGKCSLAEAIVNANNDALVHSDCEFAGDPGEDRIVFAINDPGGAPYTIDLPFSAPMPPILSPIDIDATTQPGYAGSPVVVLDIGTGSPGTGFDLSGSDGATLRGFSIINSDFSSLTGIVAGTNSQISDNWIGVRPNGTPAGLQIGIEVASRGAVVSNNVVSGNRTAISVTGSNADDVEITQNLIGVDLNGDGAIGNQNGVVVDGGDGADGPDPDLAPDTLTGLVIRSNTVSANGTGTDPAGYGVRIDGAVASPRIIDNQIGTDSARQTALPNDIGIGIGIDAPTTPSDRVTDAAIGSPSVFEGNTISGNRGAAIVLGPGSAFALVQGNIIGFDNDSGSLPNNTADPAQATNVPAEGDILIVDSSDHQIGGPDPGAGNDIWSVGSTSSVRIVSGVHNAVTRNAMRVDTGLGIDLGVLGPDANDVGDVDAPWEGPDDDPAFANNLQNSPVITGTSLAADILQVGIGLTSFDTETHYPVQIELYVADGAAGAYFIGSTILTDPAFTTIAVFSAAARGITGGTPIVALTVDDLGNTSEFSAPSLVAATGTWVVTSAGDQPDLTIDGVCETGAGVCTLRAAMQEAVFASGADTIVFNVASMGTTTIAPASDLPIVTDSLTIDGIPGTGATCGTSWPPAPVVQLSPTAGFAALRTSDAGQLTLRGLIVNGTTSQGLYLDGPSNLIECNFIGTNAAGTAASGSRQTAVFANSSDANTIERNLIAGNNSFEHLGLAGSNDNVVRGNRIGTEVTGTVRLGSAARSILVTGDGNVIGSIAPGEGNVISGGNFAGVDVGNVGLPVTGNTIRGNSIFGNGTFPGLGLGIDLDGSGVTLNHTGVAVGPNEYQNFPVLTVAQVSDAGTRVVGYLDTPNAGVEDAPTLDYAIDIYANGECDPTSFGEGQQWLGQILVTDFIGRVSFDETLTGIGGVEPAGITATATDLDTGSTSEFSYCRPASTTNTNWVQAQTVNDGSSSSQYIVEPGMEKWFRFPAGPGADVSVVLTGLPGSAVSIHTDPLDAYNQATNPNSAVALAAEAADTGFLPSGSLPSGSLPSGSLPSGSLPSGSLPSGSLETGFLPSGSLPSGSLPSGSLPSGSLPSGSLPSGSLPSGSLPSGSLPSGSLPSGSLPSGSLPSGSLPSGSLPSGSLPSGSLPSGSLDAYSTASRRSLLAYSANPYATVQSIERNTFDYAGDIWVRVVGPYSTEQEFTLQVDVTGGVCGALAPITGAAVTDAAGTGLQTVILTDSSRIAGTSAQITEALADLARFAGRSDVRGVVVDLAAPQYARVQSANAQADALPNCAFAKNLVAEEIKDVVDSYRLNNPDLAYVVLAGSADVIPFHQVSDVAGLANEKEYVPPVAANTPTEAGLRSGLVKGQDFYGSAVTLTVGGRALALPDLAVGRLVDGAADVSLAIEAYEATDGVVTPSSSLVTGYDFVGDAAATVAADFVEGIGTGQVSFIQPPGQAPTGPDAWTANQLRPALLSGDNDVIMLTGHFSAGKLLAADYRTTILASEVQSADASFADTIVLALGCHGGFSLPSSDLLEGASPDPDWAKAFLRKGAASFIAATGYAYGDTELEEYGERLFIELARQMRTGTGPIAMGDALVAAKQAYLQQVPQLSGLDEKTLVEMTLYGLPMMKVDVPGQRLAPAAVTQIVPGSTVVPGGLPGLTSANTTVSPEITTRTVPLEDLDNGGTVITQYATGREGVVAVPFQPVLPKQIDGVDVAGQVLRGIALRGGTYTDASPVVPFTSAPTTELSRPIQAYQSDVFTPTQVFAPNFYGTVAGGQTRVVTFPQQYRSNGIGSIDGTVRTWSDIQLQFFYLRDDWFDLGDETTAAAVSPAPAITGASGDVEGDSVTFTVNVQADGSAGVQAVWILYTGEGNSPFNGQWLPVDLAPVTLGEFDDPTLWTGTLPLNGADPSLLRFMVQAVGGAGLTTLDTNLGAFYRVGVDNAPPVTAEPTSVTISAPTSTVYGQPQTFGAFVSGPFVTPGAVVDFELAGQRRSAVTNGVGVATVTFTPLGEPGDYEVTATVRGTSDYLGATATQPIALLRAPTTLALSVPAGPQPTLGVSGVTATLTSGDLGGLGGKPVVFTLVSGAGTFERVIITDAWGVATLGDTGLPAGSYTVTAAFGGTGEVDVQDATFAPSTSAAATLVLADLTAPTITAAATTVPSGLPYVADTWTRSDVTVTFTCADRGGSGLVSCTPPQTVSAEGITTAVTGTAVDGAGLSTSLAFGPVKIDRSGPTITVTTPAANATYALGAAVNASYGCVDTGVGGATCVGTVASGQPIDTATAGAKSFVVTSTDALGNTSTRTVNYTVAAANTAPVVVADMGVSGLQEIGFRGNAVLITGTFTDPDGAAPYRATAQWSTGGAFTPFAIAANGQIAAAFVYGSAGVRTVTIRVCDAANNCGTDTITVRVGITQRVTPVLQCVTDRGALTPRYRARFGYNNPAPFPIAAPTIPLLDNTFFPLPAFRGQPQVFLPGNQRDVFTADFGSGTLSWTLQGTTVTARTTTVRC